MGFHAVLAILERQPRQVEVVWLGEGVGGMRAKQVLAAARQAGVRFARVSRRQLDGIAKGVAHNGFAARVAPVPFASGDELLHVPAPACLLAVDGVEDPRNLGALIRVAAGLGLGGVVVGGPHPPPLGGAVAKTAAGTLPLIPIARTGSLGDWARRASEAGFSVWGADPRGRPVQEVELPEKMLLCLGGERGLRAKTRQAMEGMLAIPLSAQVDSLNLSVAAAILAWEWRRRYPAC